MAPPPLVGEGSLGIVEEERDGGLLSEFSELGGEKRGALGMRCLSASGDVRFWEGWRKRGGAGRMLGACLGRGIIRRNEDAWSLQAAVNPG